MIFDVPLAWQGERDPTRVRTVFVHAPLPRVSLFEEYGLLAMVDSDPVARSSETSANSAAGRSLGQSRP